MCSRVLWTSLFVSYPIAALIATPHTGKRHSSIRNFVSFAIGLIPLLSLVVLFDIAHADTFFQGTNVQPFLLFVYACLVLLMMLFMFDVMHDNSGRIMNVRWYVRMLHPLAIIDTRLMKTGQTITFREFVVFVKRIVPDLMIHAAGYYLFQLFRDPFENLTIPASLFVLAVRGIAFGTVLYCIMSELYILGYFLYGCCGIDVPHYTHVHPIRSKSVGEFWGRRWNLTISNRIREHVYSPLARSGHPILGRIWSFLVSAAFHALPVFLSVPDEPHWCISVLMFMCAHVRDYYDDIDA